MLQAAAQYIEQHNLQKVVEDAINATIKAKPSEPFSYMVRGMCRRPGSTANGGLRVAACAFWQQRGQGVVAAPGGTSSSVPNTTWPAAAAARLPATGRHQLQRCPPHPVAAGGAAQGQGPRCHCQREGPPGMRRG